MAHPDLNLLLQNLLPFAQQMINEHGEFFPFGATIDAEGKIALCGADTGSEQPPSQECSDLLLGGFKVQAKEGKIRACGIVYDVRTIPPGQTEKVDAICLRLEHNSGEAVDVYQPYLKGGTGQAEYADLFAGRGQKIVFGNEQQGLNFPPKTE